MARDADQSIYCISSPYRRAGIDIVGRTRVLHTNFRNTLPIHDLAEMYRISSAGIEFDVDNAPTAFRDGPIPEIHRSTSREKLRALAVDRALLYIERLEYDPENVCILTPSNTDLDKIKQILSNRGYVSDNIRDKKYSFKDESVIKLSTLHSSKGLDFPVVLLFLPGLPSIGEYDNAAIDKLYRNLIYVAMTRAMDNLDVFVLSKPKEQSLNTLSDVFDEFIAQQMPETK